MDFVLACNWDERLIDVARKHGVTELFGKLHLDMVGGGRASFLLPKQTRREAANYIRKVHDAGIQFNYLLNGTCLGNRELTRAGQKELDRLVGWAWDAGVRWFTVSIPYLARKIKRRYPDSHIVVSMMAGVESVETAKYWEEAGAEVLILFDAKDFYLLRALKEHTGLKLEVAANLSCMNRCHQTFYHGNVASHGSNASGSGLFTLPVCETRCTYMKVKEPRRIIAGQWVRPDDLHVYEELGIGRVKFLDRISPTEQLDKILAAYRAGAYDGNLAELIPGYRQDRVEAYLNASRLPRMVQAFLRPEKYNVFKALPFARRNRQPSFTIDNRALDGFLDGFSKRDCRNLSCAECGWCDRYAEQAISFDPEERARYLSDVEKNLEELESGSFFSYLPANRKEQ